jgi:MarR family transcriptional regulator, organic hydroperoxide resistance regulator
MKLAQSKYGKCLYFTSNALARKIDKLAQESWSKVGLSPSHAYLLMLVLERPGIQPGDIAEHLQLQPSTITRLIEKLEEKKLLVRTAEGKITNVYPTPKAKELVPKLNECMNEFCSRCSALMGKEEGIRLVQNMGKLADKLVF